MSVFLIHLLMQLMEIIENPRSMDYYNTVITTVKTCPKRHWFKRHVCGVYNHFLPGENNTFKPSKCIPCGKIYCVGFYMTLRIYKKMIKMCTHSSRRHYSLFRSAAVSTGFFQKDGLMNCFLCRLASELRLWISLVYIQHVCEIKRLEQWFLHRYKPIQRPAF